MTAPPALPTVRTDRLVLRPWRPEDRDAFADLNADEWVMEHFPAPLDRAGSDELAGRFEARWDAGELAPWAVEVADGAPFIGFVGLLRATFLPGEPVEVGWRLARDHWGRGLATEAAVAALAQAFGPLDLDEVISFTVPANVRSQATMARAGLERRPERDFDHPRIDPTAHPHLVRHVLFAADGPGWRRWNARSGHR